MTNLYKVKEFWDETFDMFSNDQDFGNICFTNIINLYSNTNRYYHNLDHILSCINEFNSYNDSQNGKGSLACYCNDVDLRLAIILHDVIYDAGSSKNEEKSVDFVKMVLTGAKPLGKTIIPDVCSLILLTKHNGSKPIYFAENLLLDIDLSILGADRDTFEKYESDIRKEYSWVTDKVFNKGRLRIIDEFLNRKKIYNISYFYDRYEEVARENLKYSRELLLSKIG